MEGIVISLSVRANNHIHPFIQFLPLWGNAFLKGSERGVGDTKKSKYINTDFYYVLYVKC
jgi:hypothetical protein